eukprot:4192802-Alexandrium_andersonii.AAC.1
MGAQARARASILSAGGAWTFFQMPPKPPTCKSGRRPSCGTNAKSPSDTSRKDHVQQTHRPLRSRTPLKQRTPREDAPCEWGT